MMIVLYSLVFILGLCVGSFVLCVLMRLHDKNSFIQGRSECTACHKKLAWFELLPIVSFVFLRGRCRYCRATIPWYYLVAELSMGVLYVWVFWFYNFHHTSVAQLLRDLFFVTILGVIFIYDALYKLVIPGIIGVGILGGFIFNYLILAPWSLLAIVVGGGFFLVQHFISKGRWIGIGDAYIGIMMGVWLGWPLLLVAILISYIVGAVFGVMLVILKKKKLQSEISLGSFLAIGTLVALFFGEYFLKLILF
jgi:leader peptidase (prepilin peptidase)/N-methyltransferase